jgi:hypothetical protein
MFYGIETAQPIAFMEKRIGPIRLVSYLVTQFIDGKNARDFFLSDREPADRRLKVAEKITDLIYRLGTLRIKHGDMKATNLAITDEQVYLLDLDALRQYKGNFSFNHLHRRDILRFLRNWEEDSPVRKLFDRLTYQG